ncbi:hypothetical protein ACFSUD_03335 [Sulfitobacter aestuarii]|uniref:Uncharacterized protein n=1 Tax=Sulfitobacter aestuarii TaxID=2161676 RepID=A0ABW5TYN0_9RHOB
MNSELDRQACTVRCWWMGAAIALVLAILLWILVGVALLTSLIIGILLGAAAGAALIATKCRDSALPDREPTPHRSEPDRAPEASGAALASTSMAAGAGAAVADPDPQPPAEPNAAGTTSAVEFVSEAPDPQPVPEPQAEPGPVVEDHHATPAGVETVAAPPPDTAPADGAPEVFDAPRDGGADDLKRINGVGPKMEETLNELGIYHFDQIAGWSESEIDWVDARLRFKGRIRRDDWIGQARSLGANAASQGTGRVE